MPNYKLVDVDKLEADLTTVANAIRGRGGASGNVSFPDGFVGGVEGISGSSGSPSTPVIAKDIRFMDYDGTLLYSYSVDEFAAMTELPPLPEQNGLICQGWNWNLEDIKAMGRAVDVGAMYITDDGKTRLYIHLEEGRTAPMLGVCPKGTVTVDWGDGSEPDVLTGTSTIIIQWTPHHEYGEAGDYMISLTVDGKMGLGGNTSNNTFACILRYSSSADGRNRAYQNSLQKIEIGNGITSIGLAAFQNCYNLSSINIPNGVTSIGDYALSGCFSLSSIVIPDGVTSITSYAFQNCYNLSSIAIPDGVTSIGSYAFQSCCSLSSIVIPDGVTSIDNGAFSACYNLSSIAIPDGVTSIGSQAFQTCFGLSSITIPDGVMITNGSAFQNCYNLSSINIPNGVTSIGSSAFKNCFSLSSIIISNGATIIGDSAFSSCYSMKFYDFTTYTAVPTLFSTNAFYSIPDDCEIRVPAALYDEWIAATNWATYAAKIVAV